MHILLRSNFHLRHNIFEILISKTMLNFLNSEKKRDLPLIRFIPCIQIFSFYLMKSWIKVCPNFAFSKTKHIYIGSLMKIHYSNSSWYKIVYSQNPSTGQKSKYNLKSCMEWFVKPEQRASIIMKKKNTKTNIYLVIVLIHIE